jgi:hypothetical protein
MPPTFTCITFPAFETVRVALSEVSPPQAVTAALPADRDFEPSARLAAAPQAAETAATASASPRMFASSFIAALL